MHFWLNYTYPWLFWIKYRCFLCIFQEITIALKETLQYLGLFTQYFLTSHNDQRNLRFILFPFIIDNCQLDAPRIVQVCVKHPQIRPNIKTKCSTIRNTNLPPNPLSYPQYPDFYCNKSYLRDSMQVELKLEISVFMCFFIFKARWQHVSNYKQFWIINTTPIEKNNGISKCIYKWSVEGRELGWG